MDDELKDRVLHWLREGNELSAAAILSRCDVAVEYVDDVFVVSRNEDVPMYEVKISARRSDQDAMQRANGALRLQIENAIRQFSTPEFAIGDIVWLPKVGASAPHDTVVSNSLRTLSSPQIFEQWQKALDRCTADAPGAITAARTLLETVCKHILDEASVGYKDSADLPELYDLVAKQLSLAPSQHTEQAFRQILGGCFSVVNGLATVRNRLGDAHGAGRTASRPSPRHAALAVNLAGAIALFLVQTWEVRTAGSTDKQGVD